MSIPEREPWVGLSLGMLQASEDIAALATFRYVAIFQGRDE